jgi:hypothetical protein
VLVLVGVSEDNLGKWCSTAGVVENLLNNSLDVSKIINETLTLFKQ